MWELGREFERRSGVSGGFRVFLFSNRDLSKANLHKTHLTACIIAQGFLKTVKRLLMLVQLDEVTKPSLKNSDFTVPISHRDAVQI